MEFTDTLFVRDTGSTAYRVAADLVRESDAYKYVPSTNIYTPVGTDDPAGASRTPAIPTFEKHRLPCRISYLDIYGASSRGPDNLVRFLPAGSARTFETVDESTQEQYHSFAVACHPDAWYNIVKKILNFRISISDVQTNPEKQKRLLGEPPSIRRQNQLEFFADQCEFISLGGSTGNRPLNTRNRDDRRLINAINGTSLFHQLPTPLEYFFDPVSVVYNHKTELINIVMHARDYYV